MRLFESSDVAGGEQSAHLGDGDVVQGPQALRLRESLADKDGVEAFEIGEDDELLQRGVVADVALRVGMSIAPLLRGLAEEGDVEQVGLAGIHGGRLRFGDGRRDEGVLYRVGVDAVIDLCEGALEIPTELEAVVFFVLEALEFLDQVELEFRAEPRAELEGDVLVGVGAAVAAGTRDETIGSGQVDPLLGREEETVPARLISNSLEFEGIKTGVVDAFPDAEEQDGVLVLEPLLNQRACSIKVPHHVGERNIVAARLREDCDGRALNFNDGFPCSFHRSIFANSEGADDFGKGVSNEGKRVSIRVSS